VSVGVESSSRAPASQIVSTGAFSCDFLAEVARRARNDVVGHALAGAVEADGAFGTLVSNVPLVVVETDGALGWLVTSDDGEGTRRCWELVLDSGA